MSLVTQVSDLATATGTAIKVERAKIGTLANLTTTEKSNLVAAINEVMLAVGSGGSIDADSISDATTVGKALIRAVDAAAARTAIGAGTSNLALGTTSSTAKAGDYQPSAANISDSTSAGRALLTAASVAAQRTALDVFSQAEVASEISDAVDALVNGAPGALDTLQELADALGNDENFATTISTALGNRLRVDAAQSLSGPQQAQGQANLSVYSRAEIGDPTTDFVSILTSALA
ncbi:hypothetical protein [Mycolicibacter algericus]|uniref:Uncharacterized protein n=2 Tax=Mycolicibacter algericus TaxID=1288388 RepID=A0A7I9Y404_MYCAL|nr:hypothetical protein [Mycolicibacter algericus]OQZ94311.1 hypothetical protein BST10_18735 [Mycolicibacter algericus DSM 45454]GFG83399.1 hypothetical protein MALGJ_00750 [Mycolicibacter algericus]